MTFKVLALVVEQF